uniref:Uncharacterized protein n=1 Tax=Cryptomonas curvata TaxID=233186 RepID=A0A6T8CWK0_9CRYP
MPEAARQAIIYHDTDHLMNSLAGFQTMNPNSEPQASSVICKRIKDYTAETKAAQTAIELSKPEGTKADFKKIENISKVLLQELDIDHRVKLKRDALQAVMQHSAYLDTQSITLMLTKIISAVHDLLQYGKLTQRFPELQRYKNGPRWLLGKAELKELLETGNSTHKATKRPATQSSKKGSDLEKHSDLGGSLEPAELENERGGQLALELSSKTIGEAKRILGERIIKLIEPELTWTKDAEKMSGKIAAQIVSTFDDNSADSPNFRNVCYLVFNLRRLYSQALGILKDLNTAHHQIKDSSPMKDRSGVSNLQHWLGHEGCQSLAGNRCSPPLYSSTSPTTIGIIFVPHCNCEIVRFTTFLCLATTKTTREARDRDRSKALGVSFKFLVLKWNLQTRNTEDVIYISEEQLVTEHSFERFVLNCVSNPHISVQRNQAVMLALTSSSCEAYCKGAAWVSGLGLKDKKGAKTPEPAELIREGTYVFAGLPDGDPRNVWMKLAETMACEIEYNTVD